MRRTAMLAALAICVVAVSVQSAHAATTPNRSVDYATPGYKGLKKAPRQGAAPGREAG